MLAGNQSFTILGAAGFIGAALVGWLESHDQTVHAITRAALPALLNSHRPVGHVIDCIGLTGDFRSRPLDAADAHVGIVAQCLRDLTFDSFLLLSSTCVYARATSTHEDAILPMRPGDASDLYGLTKLAGETICLAAPERTVRIARLSDVYGVGMPDETFLGQVFHQGQRTGGVMFRETPASTRDYVDIAAIVRILPLLTTKGSERIYNVAAGCNTSHAALACSLRDTAGWHTSFADDSRFVRFPSIETARLDAEFGPTDSNLIADLPILLALEQECQCSPSMKHMVA